MSLQYMGPLDRIFEKYARVKHPSLSLDTKEAGELRHAFFVGVWAMMGQAQRINNLNHRRGENLFKELYAETKSVLDPMNNHNIHGIIVPRNKPDEH